MPHDMTNRQPRAVMLQRVKGIGAERAKNIVNTFGDEINEAICLDNIDTLASVISGKKAVTPYFRTIAAKLIAEWNFRLKPEYEAAAWLEEKGINAPRLAIKFTRLLGEKTKEILSANPYILARALPWKIIDNIGKKVFESDLKAPERLLGAVDSSMAAFLSNGNTAALKPELLKTIKRLLRCSDDVADEAFNLAVNKIHVLDSGDIVRSPGSAWMESEIQNRINSMLTSEKSGVVMPERYTTELVHAWASKQDHLPTDEQIDAIKFILMSQVSILTGGAGVGKTSTIKGIVEVWEEADGKVQLCTLSGKAALRLSQATHRLAKTLHRFTNELKVRESLILEGAPIPDSLSFLDDETLIIIDEASMVDLGMICKIIHNMPLGCKLLFVGDPAQLPPIGPGIVFHELAKIDTLTRRLTKVFRQTEATGIPAVAASIKSRKVPELPELGDEREGVSYIACPADDINQTVADIVNHLGGFQEGSHELQIVAALNARVDTLNASFHTRKAEERQQEVKGNLGGYFSPGDPVVFLANDYKRALFNGLLGTVVEVDTEFRTVTAVFEGTEHTFNAGELIDLQPAYALSCHKLQGSQTERVIIILEPTRLLEPSWLYTAITRAEKQAVLVGPTGLIEYALNQVTAWERRIHGFNLNHLGASA